MTFREQTVDEFIKKFGEPEVTSSELGPVYRWRLERKDHLDVHVIIDSPELTDQVHVIVSDPCEDAAEPVRSMLLIRMDEVAEGIESVYAQWKRHDCWPSAR